MLKAQGHLIIPIVFLLYMLFMSGSTVVYAAVLTIGVTILVAALKKTTRMKPKAIVDALAEGAKQTVSVAIACACVGIVVGVSSKTGFGAHHGQHHHQPGEHQHHVHPWCFTMITCMILGHGPAVHSLLHHHLLHCGLRPCSSWGSPMRRPICSASTLPCSPT